MSGSGFPTCVCLVLCWILERCGGLHKLLRFFGDRSLELYLTHVLIGSVFRFYVPTRQWDRWGIGTYAVILLLSMIVSILFHPINAKLCKILLRSLRKESV